jgi:hypothetical protein
MSINKENVKDIKLIDGIIDGTQNITFDNTISGLSSTTLKAAIDEVAANLNGTDTYVTSGSVSQDTLTLTLSDGGSVNVDISGIQNTTVDTGLINFDTAYSETGNETEGAAFWNPDEQTLNLQLNGATLQVGQEQVILVRNNTVTDIPDGTVLMATGSIGNSGRITVAPHNGQQGYARYIVGVATETIPAGTDGFATTFGKVRGISTDGSEVGETWTDGTVLYVKPNDGGVFTSTEPADTEIKMPVAFVLHAHASNGTIFVRVNPFDENHFNSHLTSAIDGLSTNLVLSGNTLQYTNIDGVQQDIDLSPYLDDTTNTISSGVLSGNTITFTREDSSTFTVDVTNLYDDTNLVTSVAGRTGAVTLAEADITDLDKYTQSEVDTNISTAQQNAIDEAVALAIALG